MNNTGQCMQLHILYPIKLEQLVIRILKILVIIIFNIQDATIYVAVANPTPTSTPEFNRRDFFISYSICPKQDSFSLGNQRDFYISVIRSQTPLFENAKIYGRCTRAKIQTNLATTLYIYKLMIVVVRRAVPADSNRKERAFSLDLELETRWFESGTGEWS